MQYKWFHFTRSEGLGKSEERGGETWFTCSVPNFTDGFLGGVSRPYINEIRNK